MNSVNGLVSILVKFPSSVDLSQACNFPDLSCSSFFLSSQPSVRFFEPVQISCGARKAPKAGAKASQEPLSLSRLLHSKEEASHSSYRGFIIPCYVEKGDSRGKKIENYLARKVMRALVRS